LASLTDSKGVDWLWIGLTGFVAGWCMRASLPNRLHGLMLRAHRAAFRAWWRWRSRRRGGRPRLNPALLALIRRLGLENPLWGAPRIHGELLKLGLKVSQSTVSKYMLPRRGRETQTWMTFLRNHGALRHRYDDGADV
jgi:hypothetical protein